MGEWDIGISGDCVFGGRAMITQMRAAVFLTMRDMDYLIEKVNADIAALECFQRKGCVPFSDGRLDQEMCKLQAIRCKLMEGMRQIRLDK